MPIYEYKCAKCSGVFEILVRSAADEKLLKCPRCGGKKCQKVFSVFAAQGTSSKASSGGGGSCAGCHSGHCSHCGH